MVRTTRHKLSVFHGKSCGELYDLKRDPNETHNLWCNTAYQSVKMELMQHLCDRMTWTVGPLPVRQAAY